MLASLTFGCRRGGATSGTPDRLNLNKPLKLLFNIFLAIPAAVSAGYWVVSTFALFSFLRRRGNALPPAPKNRPRVTVLKPVYGLERGAYENFRSFLVQDYPDYDVIFGVQREDDPVLPVVRRLAAEFPDRARVVVDTRTVGPNGKVNNMVNCYRAATGKIIVISDADIRVRPDYLNIITAPLDTAGVGAISTLYRAADALSLPEKLELLSFNTEFIPNVAFATSNGISDACLGASIALKRETLDRIGGFEPLADYLVEDYEMGRKIWEAGEKVEILPYFVDTTVDLAGYRTWFDHQVYWDQNTRAAKPHAFYFTILLKGIPFGLFLTLANGFAPWALAVLVAVTGIRLISASATLALIGDRTGLGSVWLLPLRDMVALATWFLSITKNHTIWKDRLFHLEKGRLVEVGRIGSTGPSAASPGPGAT